MPITDPIRAAAHEALEGKGVPNSYSDRVLDTVYPLIVRHVADEIRAGGPRTYPAQSNYNLIMS